MSQCGINWENCFKNNSSHLFTSGFCELTTLVESNRKATQNWLYSTNVIFLTPQRMIVYQLGLMQ